MAGNRLDSDSFYRYHGDTRTQRNTVKHNYTLCQQTRGGETTEKLDLDETNVIALAERKSLMFDTYGFAVKDNRGNIVWKNKLWR